MPVKSWWSRWVRKVSEASGVRQGLGRLSLCSHQGEKGNDLGEGQ